MSVPACKSLSKILPNGSTTTTPLCSTVGISSSCVTQHGRQVSSPSERLRHQLLLGTSAYSVKRPTFPDHTTRFLVKLKLVKGLANKSTLLTAKAGLLHDSMASKPTAPDLCRDLGIYLLWTIDAAGMKEGAIPPTNRQALSTVASSQESMLPDD